MSAPTDQITEQFNEIATRTQESVSTAVRTWADALQSVADGFTGDRPALPDANVFVDKYFDFAQQVLDSQRQFAHTVLTAGTQAAQTVTEQATAAAKQVTAQTVNAVESTTEKATAATRAAGEKTAATARAAKAAGRS
jgi:hypothetical protein